jgi:hypothetical protein
MLALAALYAQVVYQNTDSKADQIREATIRLVGRAYT